MLLALAAAAATLQPPHHDAYGYAQRGWFDRLLYPIELNPEKRLPRVEGDLIDIAFSADGKTGFALGEGGAILMTENGGLDWRVSREAGEPRLRAIAVSADGEMAAAAGEDDILLGQPGDGNWRSAELDSSAAAGAEFTKIQVSADGTDIQAFADPTFTGGTFTVFGSVDRGSTWSVIGVPSGLIQTIAFDDAGRNGWLGMLTGELYSTVDGGASWVLAGADILSAPANAEDEAADAGSVLGAAPMLGAMLLAPQPEKSEPAVPTGVERYPVRTTQGPPDLESSGSPNPPASATPVAAPSRPTSRDQSGRAPNVRKATEFPRPTASGSASNAPAPSPAFDAETATSIERDDTIRMLTAAPIIDLAAVPGARDVAGIRALAEATELFVGRDGYKADARLYELAMGSPRAGWAVGDFQIWATRDGATWSRQLGRDGPRFASVAAARDGQRAWVAGQDGTLLATVDGGSTWFDQLRRPGADPSGSYWRFPAPWFYLTLIGFGGFVAWARRPPPAKPREAFDGIGATDAPVISLADDKLQFAPLARGISRYLRNANTRPPLTLAISGDWGSGKSSLMRMVCEDLRRRGNHPVWFNAWHHQGEEQLLAALLTAIRDTALPPWLSLDGLRFRALLLLKRARRRLPATLVLVAIAGFGLAVIVRTDWSEIAAGLQTLFTGGKGTGLWESDILKSAPGIAALVTVLAGVLKALTAFGANPAVLLTSTIDNFKLRDASAQVHFRTRFQQQFREVAEALPYPLVIVIDDLDRCRPETVLQVMESVNFLMSSGECFVLFGMATHRVQAALAHSFKDIAGELVEIDDNTPATVSAEGRDRAEREKRLKYAGEYLQKLINLDIRVPRREDIAPHLLLTRDRPPEAYDRNEFAIARRWAGLLWPLLLAAGIAGGAWWAGSHVLSSATPPAGEPAKVAGAISSTPSAAVPTREVGATAAPIQAETGAARPVEVIEGAKGRGGIDWAVAILLGAVLAIVAILQYRKRKADALVFDTKPFTDALKVWTPIVARRYNSPRAIKRFGNRLRYFAMLQQAEEPVEEAPTDWRSRLRFRGESATASIAFKPDKARVDVVAEHRIVALGAIHEVFGDKYWRIWVTEGKEPSPKPFAEPADYGDVAKAVAAYQADGRRWPPSAEELDAFERSLKGIRLDGEVAVIAETEPAPEPPRSRTPKQTPPKLKARSNSTDRGSRFVELETPVGSKERG